MRTYGADKYDKLSCDYGCCGGELRDGAGNGSSGCRARRPFAKRARRRARQEGRRQIQEALRN